MLLFILESHQPGPSSAALHWQARNLLQQLQTQHLTNLIGLHIAAVMAPTIAADTRGFEGGASIEKQLHRIPLQQTMICLQLVVLMSRWF